MFAYTSTVELLTAPKSVPNYIFFVKHMENYVKLKLAKTEWNLLFYISYVLTVALTLCHLMDITYTL